jgi:hypothetical protein
MKIELPYNDWEPREHQLNLWEYLQRGGKRAVAVWHRRAGKDEVTLHHTAVAAMQRPANYWHCFPEFTQARKALWDAVNPHTGKRRIDEAFPHEIRSSTSEHEMRLKFINGSTWQVIGSDSVTSGSGIGSSTAGIVFSEYALANPAAWGYYRPILEENQGWAAFIFTPRGRNHGYELFRYASARPDWFSERLTVDDTAAISHQAIAEALAEYTAIYGADAGRAMFDQELYCSFNAAILGAFWAREMADVRSENRIQPLEPDISRPIHRAWDLGVRDDTSVIWFQACGPQILILDHLASSGVGVEWFRDEIFERHDARGWIHGTDFVPHDAKIKEWGTGRTRVETMQTLGLHPQLVPLAGFEDGIDAARRTLPLCLFDPRTEDSLVAALEQYRREWDTEKRAFRANDVHDWTAHPAASFRYLSLAWKPAPRKTPKVELPSGWIIPPPPERRQSRSSWR